jgi:hypothetical protein
VLPADAIGPKMARLRREHHRMLGNGYCTRPAELDCAFESICQTCTFFQTSIEFRPALQAQHDDAIARHQDLSVTDRARQRIRGLWLPGRHCGDSNVSAAPQAAKAGTMTGITPFRR